MISLRASNRILFVLSLAGAGIALYLTLAHKNYLDLQCGASSGCDKVAHHSSAHGFGIPALSAIPTAAFGLLLYLLLGALSFARVLYDGRPLERTFSAVQWLLAFSGVLVSTWLTYMEAFVIRAWCKWCVASAVIVVLMFLILSVEQIAGRRQRLHLATENPLP